MYVLSMVKIQLTILLVVVLTLSILYVKQSFSYFKKKRIPHLQPSFPWGNIGNLLTIKKPQGYILKEIYDSLKAKGAKYGGLYLFMSPVFMPMHPEYIKHILVKDFNSFHARGFYNNEKDQPMSANVFTIDGDRWKTLRRKYSLAFTPGKIKSMVQTMTKCTVEMNKAIGKFAENKQPVSARYITCRYTADIIGSCAFGIDCNSFDDATDNTFLEHVIECLDESTKMVRFAFLHALPNLSRFLKLGLFTDNALKYFGELIVSALKYREENGVRRGDFLQIMKDMKEENFTLHEIQAQCFLFFVAGYETSATALTYLLFELGKNQSIQDKVREEIRQFLSNHQEVSFENISQMKYLESVVFEALRLYPPVCYLNRKCTEDYEIPGSGQVLEKGTNIVIPVLGLHRDAEFYPDPEKFDPDRFSEENKHKIDPFAYLPFGEGPRNCIGSRFAVSEVMIFLFNLLNKFKIKLNKNTKTTMEYTSHFVLTPSQDIILDVEVL